jgi:hypothetical protein
VNVPSQDYKSMVAAYGPVGENQTSVVLPYPMVLAWDPAMSIKRMTCHARCADAFIQIFEDVLDAYGAKDIKRLRLDQFGGCLNVRKMRGGNSWSIHSWGAAVDIDPDRNQLRWGRDKASLAKKDYDRFWQIVEEQGAVSLGREKNFDWMHFQFARLT